MPPARVPTPVRAGLGPVHIAVPTARGWRTACGKRLVSARPLHPRAWQTVRRCRDCDDIADHATDAQLLALIAGW